LLVVTEKLTCIPPESERGKPLVLGYRLARIEWRIAALTTTNPAKSCRLCTSYSPSARPKVWIR